MVLDFNTLLKLFKREYNIEMPEEELEQLIKIHFQYIREEIESGDLSHIRMKYFGSFKPMFGKLKHLEKNINWGKFTPKEKERYDKLFVRLNELLKEDNSKS